MYGYYIDILFGSCIIPRPMDPCFRTYFFASQPQIWEIRQDPKDNACENQEALQQIQERGMEVFNQQARGMIGIRKRSFRLDQ